MSKKSCNFATAFERKSTLFSAEKPPPPSREEIRGGKRLKIITTMKNEFIEMADRWMLDSLDEWQWDKNPSRYANYLGVVTCDSEGKEHVQWWCERGKKVAGYFSLHGVKVGDILMAGCSDMRRGYSVKKEYYGVVALSADEVELVGATSYRVAKRYLAEELAERGGEE